MIKDKWESKPVQAAQTQGREYILAQLRNRGLRITSQRKLILNIILKNECSCCKEIYYEALKSDSSIGIATVYRMVKTLEEMGAIDRKNMYRIAFGNNCTREEACVVSLKEKAGMIYLSGKEWTKVVETGLRSMGYLKNEEIETIMMSSCECENEGCCG